MVGVVHLDAQVESIDIKQTSGYDDDVEAELATRVDQAFPRPEATDGHNTFPSSRKSLLKAWLRLGCSTIDSACCSQ